jgi:hypothetical protein
MIIYHFILIITIWVFHKHYYDEVAQVKCSLSRSDDDSNRLLTSWWFILHTSHTHPLRRATGHRINFLGKRLGFDRYRRTQGPPDYSLALPSCPCVHSLLSQYSALRSTPGLNSFPASRSERLILPVKHGACIQHDLRDNNDWSLTDTDEITIVQNHARLYQSPFLNNSWLYFVMPHLANSNPGNHLKLVGDRKSSDFYRSKQG